MAAGAILAGWEIDPNWQPRAGDKVVIEFIPSTTGGQFPARITIVLSSWNILMAVGARMGGQKLSEAMEAAAFMAAAQFGGHNPAG
jgi:hypothetical protein